MLVIASLTSDFAVGVGALAGMIAVGGFLGHAPLVFRGASDRAIQQATAAGGLTGSVIGASVIVLSAITGMVNS